MLRESSDNPTAHMTFFGGETLMNFPVLKSTIAYARRRAAEVGKEVDFSLTTNATLLRPGRHRVPGREPRWRHDLDRWPRGAAGQVPRLQERHGQLRRRRAENQGAAGAASLAADRRARHADASDARRRRIYRHLTEEMGFWEVGFAPVTTAPKRDYAISDGGFDELLAQFKALALEYRDAALENRHHGFSNVRETLQELHQGHAKAYPCGAGIGLMGVATDGDVALCHRFAGSDTHRLGDVRSGVSWERQQAFLDTHHIAEKTDCRTCWARPICAGGCYHEANTRYGSTDRAEPALLRVDSRLDAHLPGNLRRDRGEEPGVPRGSSMTRRRERCRRRTRHGSTETRARTEKWKR